MVDTVLLTEKYFHRKRIASVHTNDTTKYAMLVASSHDISLN
jgi:hypothetical protein